MEYLNLNKLLNWFLDWKITFILHCGNNLLTDLYKHFLRFKESFPRNGRLTISSLLGTVGTICLATFNLSKNFLILFELFDQLYWQSSCYIWKYFSGVLLLYESFPYWNKFWKTGTEACGLNLSCSYQK